MDNGDTGISGAVDFDPNEEPKTSGYSDKVSEDDIRFRADKIDQNRSADLLLKEEDKKKRKRDEERRAKDEAKKVLREARRKKHKESHASKEVQDAERELNAEQGRIMADQRRNRRAGFYAKISDALFGGRRKIVTISVLVVLVAGGLVAYFCFIRPTMERVAREEQYRLDIEAEQYASEFQEKIYNFNLHGDGAYKDGEDLNRALKIYEDEIAKSSREKKIFHYIFCGYLLRDINRPEIDRASDDDNMIREWNSDDIKDAVAMVQKAENLLQSDYEKSAYYEALSDFYISYDDKKSEEYEKLMNQANENLCIQLGEKCS